MIQGRSVLGLITARGGSKGLPRKNVLPLGGKPLIVWTIDAALDSSYLDRLILSSDDPEIISIAEKYGCEAPFVRPGNLASDTANSVDVALHALEAVEEQYDILVLLQPTSPFRSGADIDACIEMHIESGAGCVSITECEKSPYWSYALNDKREIVSLHPEQQAEGRRQDLPLAYGLNGAVYVVDIARFIEEKTFVSLDTRGHVMPRERSVDIDTNLDLEFARLLAGQK